MKSKLTPIVFSLLIALFISGCSKKSSSNLNANSNSANSNTSVTTVENGNLEETADSTDDSSTPSDESTGSERGARRDKSVNANAPTAKRSPDKDTTTKNSEKKIRKQGDRVLRESSDLIKEGERRVRGILNGTP